MKRRKYQHIVESIVSSKPKQDGDFARTSELATELLLNNLQLSAVSVWSFCYEKDQFKLVANHGALSNLSGDNTVRCDVCPEYLNILRNSRHIDVNDAKSDHRVDELRKHYIEPFDIASLLDVPIRINGKLEGVLNLERAHEQKNWTDSEIYIACQIADQLALTIATQTSYEQHELLTLFKSAAEQSEQVTMLINLQTERVEFVNEAYSKRTGKPIADFIGKPMWDLFLFQQKPEYSKIQLEKVHSGQSIADEVQLVAPDGKPMWISYRCSPFVTSRGNHYALMSSEDCTEQHRYREELEIRAWRCSLTGLYNRAHFNKALDKTNKGYLILVDLIGFKNFNDTYGHEKGDALLQEIARRLRHIAEIQQVQEIARVGSDEFAVLLSDKRSQCEIEQLTEKLYQNLILPAQIQRDTIDPKPAMAVVDIAAVVDLVSPLTSADLALQIAKKKQGKTIQFFNHTMLSAFIEDSEIERDLHTAVRNRQFELYYQPLRSLETGEYTGAEALVRWHHPKKGVLYPGSFIDIAEQTGMIVPMGSWILEAACRQLNLWQHYNRNLTMHVNVSARQFFSGKLFEQVWNLLNRYQIKPQSLILEITETELMEDIRFATNLCHELSELGVGLAIDDFGTGYSSMRYLKQFPISKIKIDRSFVSDLNVSKESREIVSAIIAMAKALNLSLTAEGVETEEQELFLKNQNCHQAQGFLYSPALRESDFNAFLKKSENEDEFSDELTLHH